MSIHKRSHPLAGKTVMIASGEFQGSQYRIEDYWDRVSGQSWMFAQGNPACLQYALRTSLGGDLVPSDNEVLYGKIGWEGHLIHVSEISTPAAEGNTQP